MDDLDGGSREALFSALVRLLSAHRNGARALITQLVLSLADLSVLLSDRASLDPVSSLMDQYAADPEMVSCLLEFLTELPAELHEGRLLGHDVEEVVLLRCFALAPLLRLALSPNDPFSLVTSLVDAP